MSVTGTLLSGAQSHLRHAAEALTQVGDLDSYDYEAEGKVSSVQLALNMISMVQADVERMQEIVRAKNS